MPAKDLSSYQTAVINILSEYAVFMANADKHLSFQTLFDNERHHYQISVVGWENNQRIYKNLIHIDLIDNKIWVQNNNTQFDLLEDFEQHHIPKNDIVNAMIPERKRQAA